MDIRERLAIFYQRLGRAPLAGHAAEAFDLICRVLDEVECEFCDIPKTNPPPRHFTGRMYPPQPDNISVRGDGSWLIKVRRHRIVIESNGAFRIYRLIGPKDQLEEFSKPGARS